MVDEALESSIREKFKQGERKDTILESLLQEGYSEEQIDAAISHIQLDALKQMPVVSHIIAWLESLEQKTAHASPKALATALVSCFVVIIGLSAALYFFLDPIGVKASDRDKQRETDIIKVRSAIDSHYANTGIYPSSLEALMPKYLQSIPQDPKTGRVYEYKYNANINEYQLCVAFETRNKDCIVSASGDELIPIVTEPEKQAPEESAIEPEIAEPLDATGEGSIIEEPIEPEGSGGSAL